MYIGSESSFYRVLKEAGKNASNLIQKAALKGQCSNNPLVLHSDNGSPMKAATFLETLRHLEIIASYSRPRVSNDNPFSESLFKTCKYHPEYTGKGFKTIIAAREWSLSFVNWYNNQHRHSKINFVTPVQRHEDVDKDILCKRKDVFELACCSSHYWKLMTWLGTGKYSRFFDFLAASDDSTFCW